MTNINDSGPGSLRQALLDSGASLGVADVIVFEPGFFNVIRTITLTSGQLAIDNAGGDLTINGPGSNRLMIDGNNQSRVLQALMSNHIVRLSGFTVRHGRARSGAGLLIISSSARAFLTDITATENAADTSIADSAITDEGGGGIYSSGLITMIGCTITNNTVTGRNGSLDPKVAEDGHNVQGGGLTVQAGKGAGNIKILNCRVTGNSAVGGNGGAGQVNLSGWRGMRGGDATGGGISAGKSVEIYNTTVRNNTAKGGNGGSPAGQVNPAQGGEAGLGQGGGLSLGFDSQLANSTVSGNNATGGNGGIGSMGSQDAAGGDALGGGLRHGGRVGIINSTLSGNTLTRGTGHLPGNCRGGGVYLVSGNFDLIVNTTVTANNNPLCTGGGIYNADTGGDRSTIGNTLVAGNNAASGKDVFGSFVTLGANLIGIGNDGQTGMVNGVNEDQLGTSAAPIDPKLGPLADNNSVLGTQTHALLQGSPASDKARDSVAHYFLTNAPILIDGRGFIRFFGINPDIGACEGRPNDGHDVIPVPNRPVLQNDTGISNTDGITNASTGEFEVSNIVPGFFIQLRRNGADMPGFIADASSTHLTDPDPPSDATVNYMVRQSNATIMGGDTPLTTVIYDRMAPTVTINQLASQADPATTMPLRFAVNFSETVVDITQSSFDFSGSSGIDGLTMTRQGSSPNFTYLFRGLLGPATLVISLPPGVTTDRAGNPNAASSNFDNSITFSPPPYFGSVAGFVKKSGGGVPNPGLQVVVFETTGNQSFVVPVSSSGYFKVRNIQLYTGVNKNFTFKLYRKQTELSSSSFTLTNDLVIPNIQISY